MWVNEIRGKRRTTAHLCQSSRRAFRSIWGFISSSSIFCSENLFFGTKNKSVNIHRAKLNLDKDSDSEGDWWTVSCLSTPRVAFNRPEVRWATTEYYFVTSPVRNFMNSFPNPAVSCGCLYWLSEGSICTNKISLLFEIFFIIKPTWDTVPRNFHLSACLPKLSFEVRWKIFALPFLLRDKIFVIRARDNLRVIRDRPAWSVSNVVKSRHYRSFKS